MKVGLEREDKGGFETRMQSEQMNTLIEKRIEMRPKFHALLSLVKNNTLWKNIFSQRRH